MAQMLGILMAALWLLPTVAVAGDVKTVVIAKGSIADVNLAAVAPANGVLATDKELQELCKAWKIDMPKVDFAKDLVIVGTTRGSLLSPMVKLDDDGTLVVNFEFTTDFGQGFRYLLATCPRDGVKKVKSAELRKE